MKDRAGSWEDGQGGTHSSTAQGMHSTLKKFHMLLFFFLHDEGKGDSLSEEEQQKFAELCDKTRFPKENIRYMLEKGKEVAIEGTLGIP